MLSIKEVSEMLSVSGGTIRLLIDQGELKAVRVGKQFRFDPKNVAEYIERQTVRVSTPIQQG